MKKSLLLLFVSTISLLVKSQVHEPTYTWAKSLKGSSSTGIGMCIIEDKFKNVFVGGSFAGTTDFDPGAGVTSVVSDGSGDAFIAKYDSLGNFLWVVKFEGGSFYDEISRLKVDSAGNIYGLGIFKSNSIDCITGTGTYNLNNPQANTNDFFLVKYDSNGNFIWGKKQFISK